MTLTKFTKNLSSPLVARWPILVFCLIYILVGLTIYKDFGITWDENDVYTRGEMLYQHLIAGEPQEELLNLKKADDGNVIYNHLYPATVHAVSKNIIGDTSYETYHLVNILFALPIFVLSYEVLLRISKNRYLALLGPIFIFLSPRFLGDIPANPKDVPFATLYFASLVAIYLLRNYENKVVKSLLLGLLFGLTLTTRIIGFTIFPIYIFFEVYYFFLQQKRYDYKSTTKRFAKLVLELGIVLSTSLIILTVTWPYLASNFMANLGLMFSVARDFPWVGRVLYLGERINSAELPRTYLPVWFIISTPIFILLWSLVSILRIKKWINDPLFILLGSTVGLNLALYIALKPIIYDGMRHYLFLLPIVALIAAYTCLQVFQERAKHKIIYPALLLFTCFAAILPLLKMFSLHPYQYVYFNELTGGLAGAYNKFETDYWGASFKASTMWFAENIAVDENEVYLVHSCANPNIATPYFKPNMKWVKLDEADYFICYTRNTLHAGLPPDDLLYSAAREGVPLSLVFRISK